MKQYQETPLWKNTLFVLVPDHQGAYPYPIENPLDGQTIPLILIGGAIKQPLVVDTYASQIDSHIGLSSESFHQVCGETLKDNKNNVRTLCIQ